MNTVTLNIEHLPITSGSGHYHNEPSEGYFPKTQHSERGNAGNQSATPDNSDKHSDIDHLPITSGSGHYHNEPSEGNFPMTQISERGNAGNQSATPDNRSGSGHHHNQLSEGYFPKTQHSERGNAGNQSATPDNSDKHSDIDHLPITSGSGHYHNEPSEGNFPMTQISERGNAGNQSATPDNRSGSGHHHNQLSEGYFPMTQHSERGNAGNQSATPDNSDKHSDIDHLPITSGSGHYHNEPSEGNFPMTQISERGNAGNQSATPDNRSGSGHHHNQLSEGYFPMTQISERGNAGNPSASAVNSDKHSDIEHLPITSGSGHHHNEPSEGTVGVAISMHECRRRWYLWIVSYPSFVLLLMLLAYLLNQLDRYMLAVTSKPMARTVHFGDKACDVNTSLLANVTEKAACNATTAASCLQSDLCIWDYNGQGLEYQLLAGPVMIPIYTFAGIFISFAADLYNRRNLLVACLILWSTATILTGLVEEYWQLVILRLLLGFGEAGCTPFALSILTDYFPSHMQGLVVGIYSLGIYTGYSMSYALGNLITLADIMGQGWRWSFYISGIPGVVLGVVILLTVREPARSTPATTPKPSATFSLILLFLGASVRNTGGYMWAYNTQLYFKIVGQTPTQISTYMSWVPLVGGSIGVILGGRISDCLMRREGVIARMFILTFSQMVAAPFAAATLYFSAPTCYIMQILTYIIGEMWVGVALAVLVELVEPEFKTSAIGVYLFIMTTVEGIIPLLVPPIQAAFEKNDLHEADALKNALYILYPGLYVGGGILFLLAVFSLRRDK